MIRAFFDASALFSAAYSSVGGAKALLNMVSRGDIEVVVSKEAVAEARRNLEEKASRALGVFEVVLLSTNLTYISAADTDLEVASPITETKDIHIVAAALTAQCGYIVSHDRAHLVGNKRIEEATGLRIVTPGDLLAIIRASQADLKDQAPPSNEEEDSEITQ